MCVVAVYWFFFFFFFNDTATTEIYTLSLQRRSSDLDQLPTSRAHHPVLRLDHGVARSEEHTSELQSRGLISYAVFCLKKKQKKKTDHLSPRTISLQDASSVTALP